MSDITDVILTVSLLEEAGDDDECPAVEVLNSWLFGRNKSVLKRVDGVAGGGKMMQAAVFMGAFNSLDISAFISVIDAAPWEYREGLSVFIKTENEDRFSDMTPNNFVLKFQNQ